MSETMTVSVFGAVSVLAGVVAYLYRQNTDLYKKIMEGMESHAKCLEQAARTDERAVYLLKRVGALEIDLQTVKVVQKEQISGGGSTPLPASSVVSFAKDTTIEK